MGRAWLDDVSCALLSRGHGLTKLIAVDKLQTQAVQILPNWVSTTKRNGVSRFATNTPCTKSHTLSRAPDEICKLIRGEDNLLAALLNFVRQVGEIERSVYMKTRLSDAVCFEICFQLFCFNADNFGQRSHARLLGCRCAGRALVRSRSRAIAFVRRDAEFRHGD